MSSASSPLASRRRAANIPSDQRSLLEGQDSWAVDLRNQPHGLVHIPGHILEAAKATHLAQKRKSQGQTPQSKKGSASPVASVSNKRMRNGTAATPKSNSQRPPQSSPEKSIPWSPSPPRDQPKEADSIEVAINTTTQSSIVHETPKTDSTRPNPLQPQRPSIPTFEHPPLSEESEDDMETRIPDAQPLGISINQSVVRSNRAVPFPRSTDQPMATPPCAQPSNSTQSSGPEKSGKVEMTKSRFVFKPIDVDDVGKKKKRNYPEKERLAPTIVPPVFDSSRVNSSDSFIPSTYKVPATQESIRESIEGNEDKDEEEERDNRAEVTIPSTDNQKAVEKASSRRPVSELKATSLPNVKSTAKQDKPVTRQAQQQQAQQQRVQQPTTPTRMDPPKRIASTDSRKRSVNHEVARKSPPPAPSGIAPGAPREPFETFVQHYPEYASGDGGRVAAGTKLHFITACVYLNYLRSKNLLRDCMYDEFIRAFPRYYKEYVDETQRPAMVAIKWFNKQRQAPVFNKYLVHRGNLGHIMRMYPDQFIEVNEKILKKKDGDELHIYTSSEDEDEDEEEEESSEDLETWSPVVRRSDKNAQGASPPIASFESEMDRALSEILPAHVSSSVRRLSTAAGKETEHEIRSDSTPSPEQRSNQMPEQRSERRPDQRLEKNPEQKREQQSEQRLEQRLEQIPALPSLPKTRRTTLPAQPESSLTQDITTTQAPPPTSFRTRRTTLPAQPESSRAQEIITQAPPPPSPKIPEASMLPPSSIPDPVSKRRDPRPSQYLDKLASKSRASLGSSASPRSSTNDERRRAKLLRHFRKSIGVDQTKPGANTRGARSSSGRSETGR